MNQYDEIYHFGVKGMKWGVRRFQKKDGSLTPAGKKRYDHTNELDNMVFKSKNGCEIHVERTPTSRLATLISKMSPKVRNTLANSDVMKLKVNGENIGELQLYKENPKSLNVVWVGVNKKHEGQGYGSATMKGVIEYAKKTGMNQVTLEVPGDSPNARHIYEKLGFKAVEAISDSDDVWGGLTSMRLDLKK